MRARPRSRSVEGSRSASFSDRVFTFGPRGPGDLTLQRTRTYECMCLLDNREVRKGWQPLKDGVAGAVGYHLYLQRSAAEEQRP